MIKILATILILFIIISGLGHFITNKLKLAKPIFMFPIGFVTFLFSIEILYTPIQLFRLPSIFIHIVTSILCVVLLIYALKNIKPILAAFKTKYSIVLVVALVIWAIVFYQLSVGIELTDSQLYINYICQNINTPSLNNFSFSNGQIASSPDINYIFQGYYHFASYLCWIVNAPTTYLGITGFVDNIAIIVWGLGLLFTLFASTLVINIVDSLIKNNKILKYSILAFLLLFYGYYYWRCGFAFYGNTFRTYIVAMLIYYLYRKYQNEEDISLCFIVIIVGAGLATSSSFLFISFDVFYVLMAYLFINKKERTFEDLSIMVFPIVLFAACFISYYSPLTAIVLSIIAIAYYVLLFNHIIDKVLKAINNFFYKYGKYLFLIIIPLCLIAYSYIIIKNDPYYQINYLDLFQNIADYDMAVDAFGIYSNILEKILTWIKWIAIIALVIKSFKDNKKSHFLGFLVCGIILLFLNPLLIPAISKLYTQNVYYRVWDVILNPFMIVIYVLVIYELSKKIKYNSSIISVCLIIPIILMHLGLVTPINTFTSYSYLLNDGKKVNHINKLADNDAYILRLVKEHDLVPSDSQITIISHAEGFKSFFPNTYQLFTRHDFYYPTDRVNEEFYQIAKRHYGWLEKVETDYTKSCDYIKEYNVSILVIDYIENFEFDKASDACTVTVETTNQYKIKVTK